MPGPVPQALSAIGKAIGWTIGAIAAALEMARDARRLVVATRQKKIRASNQRG